MTESQPDVERMRARNPWRIPRNHRIEELIAAAESDDYSPFHRFVDALAHPFEKDSRFADLEAAPRPGECVDETFCGT